MRCKCVFSQYPRDWALPNSATQYRSCHVCTVDCCEWPANRALVICSYRVSIFFRKRWKPDWSFEIGKKKKGFLYIVFQTRRIQFYRIEFGKTTGVRRFGPGEWRKCQFQRPCRSLVILLLVVLFLDTALGSL